MKVVTSPINTDFSWVSLKDAVDRFVRETEVQPQRIIISSVYVQGDILEAIFKVFGGLNLPFERSYALPMNAWMLVHDGGDIFYSPGA